MPLSPILIILAVVFIVLLSPIYPSKAYSTTDNKTLVAITFDDGYRCWTSEVMPILGQYHLSASAYINDPDYREDFTWADVHQLYNSGWEIGWHTGEHIFLDSVNRSEIISDFSYAAPLFKLHNLPPPATLAYPNGRHNFVAMEVASNYFIASRTTHSGVNSPNDIKKKPHHLKQYELKQGLFYLKKKIKKCRQQGTFIILLGHTVGQIAKKWQTEPDMTVNDFKDLVKFLHQEEQSGFIDVVTLKEGFERMQQRQFSCSWHLKIDSPFDKWYKSWFIPVPERYFNYYEMIIRDFIGHRRPQIACLFNRLLNL